MAKNFFKGRGTPLFLFHAKDETKKIKIRDKKLYCNPPAGNFSTVLLVLGVNEGALQAIITSGATLESAPHRRTLILNGRH